MSTSPAAAAPRLALSLAQSDIYFDQLRDADCPRYNVGGYIRLERIDVERLRSAHRRLVHGHEAFGLRLAETIDGAMQYIAAERHGTLPLQDFSAAADPGASADAWLQQQFARPFALNQGPLHRACLLKLSDDSYRYAGIAHHLAMDGWGFANWARELARLYAGGEPAVLDLTWAEVVQDDQDYLAGPRYEADRQWWKSQLDELPEPPFDARYREAGSPGAPVPSRRRCVPLPAAVRDNLAACAAAVGVSVAQVLLGALAAYCLRATDTRAVVLGLPLHNRRSRAHKDMLGVFASVSPLCVRAEGNPTLAELIRSLAPQQKAALRHQRYPVGHLVRDLGAERRSLFQVGFNYLKLDGSLSFDARPARLVYLSHGFEATPLMLTLWESDDSGSELQIDHNLAYFGEDDAERLAARLLHLLERMPAQLATPLDTLDLIPAAETALLVHGCGDDGVPPRHDATAIHRLFEAQARRTPLATAASCAGQQLSYRALDQRANSIAQGLRQVGVVAGELVGLCAPRSLDMLAAVIGILKTGAAYLPLDPAYPPERLRQVLADSGVAHVLTGSAVVTPLAMPDVRTHLIDNLLQFDAAAPGIEVAGDSLAYVIYTSGSTGLPKGVEISHGNVLALLAWAAQAYSDAELGRVLASTSLNFDISVFELFAPLVRGGEVVIVRDALALIDAAEHVSLINTVPSAMKVLIDHGAVPDGVLAINLAGEPLPMRLVNSLLAANKCRRVVNLYGPTEDTVYSTCASFCATLEQAPPIGRVIAGSRGYVLDSRDQLLPFGAIGELHLAGAGLARGYRNHPELTAQKFVDIELPGQGRTRLYRTGDRVRYLGDGQLEYLGRRDEQVKLRGFRIELGEIRHALEQLPGVAAACVITAEHPTQGLRVLAFAEARPGFDSSDAAAQGAQWRRELRTRLPAHMVPAVVTRLPCLPLMPNGKVDKAALARLDVGSGDTCAVPLAGETELALADVWSRVLDVEMAAIGAHSTLFELGGHSLLLVRLALEIRERFGVELPLRTLLEAADLRALALTIDTELTVRFIEERMGQSVMLQEGCL